MKRISLLLLPIVTLIVSLNLFSCGSGGGGGTSAKLLDALFGTGGKVTTPIGTIDDTSYALAIQSDGKIVAAGYTDTGSQFEFALVRYNTDGSLDTSFGAGGLVTTDINGIDDEVFALVIQPDGKLVAAGYSFDGSQNVFALVRYNNDGTLDTSFGMGGIVTTPIGSVENKAFALAVQSDDKLVAAGYSYDSSLIQFVFAVVRYNTDGSLDTSFGTGGIMTTDINTFDDKALALAIQSDNKLVVAGYSDDGSQFEFAVVRYNTDGTLDTSFGTGGIVTTPIGTFDDEASSLKIQSDDKLVAAGFSYDDALAQYVFALVRYNTDGTLDTTFNPTGTVPGMVTTALGSVEDIVYALTIQSDDKLVAAGYSDNGTQRRFALARYLTNGSLDTTFNKTGKIITDVGGDDAATSLAIQSDDKMVASGYSYNNSLGRYGFAVVRYLPIP